MSVLRYQAIEAGTSFVDLVYGHRVWRAEVRTLDDVAIPRGARVELVIETTTFRGTVIRATPFVGRASFVVAGGGGGWRLPCIPTPLRSDGGIRLATALQTLETNVATAATKSGGRGNPETIQLDGADRALGKAWTPMTDRASALMELFGEPWFVDAEGVTRVGYTSAAAISSAAYAVGDVDTHGDILQLAPRTAAGLAAIVAAIKGTIAGDPIPGTFRIGTLRIVESGKLRVEVHK